MSILRRRLPRLVMSGSVLATLGVALLALGAGPVAAQAQGAKEVDGTAENKWVPNQVTIKPGESVTFKVAGGGTHPVGSGTSPTAKDNRFDTSKCQLPQMTRVGQSCTVKFPKAGTYPFFCEIHYALGMTGTIQVGAGGGGTATTAAAGAGGGNVVATPSTGAPASPGKPSIYYAGYGLVAAGVLLGLFAFVSYVRFAPGFRREHR